MSDDDRYVVSEKPKLNLSEKVLKRFQQLFDAGTKEYEKAHKSYCGRSFYGHMACSRPVGHTGHHMARGVGDIALVWRQGEGD